MPKKKNSGKKDNTERKKKKNQKKKEKELKIKNIAKKLEKKEKELDVEKNDDYDLKEIEKELIIINNDDSYSSENVKNEMNNDFDSDNENSENNSSENQDDFIYKGSLNNNRNPFIIASKKYSSIGKNKKHIENEKETYNQQYENENNYENMPPKYFNILRAKLINKENIEKKQKNGDNENYWYTELIFNGKKFKKMTKNKNAKTQEYIYYYCSLHITAKNSEEKTEGGYAKRKSYCNARIVYIKSKKEYYMDWNHSKYCNAEKHEDYENIKDINEEVHNYENFRKSLINYLNSYPNILLSDFIKKANKLYDFNKCNFTLKKYALKNIYYNWKKNSLIFTKYYAFENNLTLNKEFFLRDYSYLTLYNKSGKTQFIHEHMIFVSNYFIRKLRASKHFYIDGTFLYPKGFSQLIVVLYIDDQSGKRYPGLYALINNKKEEGYKVLFDKIKFILTLENQSELNLKTYCVDFEKALINATCEVFPNIRQIGCYYHYCRNIREKTREFKLNTKNLQNNLKSLLNDLYKLPFIYHDNKESFDIIKNKFENLDQNFKDYLNYFENQWLPYFSSGNLDYHYISKELRSNSYIENYNRRIKLKLSKFLFGKNHCLITWPLFLYFIKQEENDYRTETYNNENELIIQNKKIKKLKKIKNLNSNEEEKANLELEKKNNTNLNNIEINKERKFKKWFKWHYNSCRYDSFTLIYALIIKPRMEKENLTPQNEIINYINELSYICLNLTEDKYEDGIWNILRKNKNNLFDLTTKENRFKKKGSMVQLINMLRFSNFFCFEYKLLEGCSKCNYKMETNSYLNPYIIIRENDLLKQESIPMKINQLMINELTTCKLCGYENQKIKDINNPSFYRIITEKFAPNVFFIIFDLLNESEEGSDLSLQLNEFNKRIKYNNRIIDSLKATFEYDKILYELKAVICTPQYDHFTSLIINYDLDMYTLKKNSHYYYDDTDENHDVVPVENYNTILEQNYPYVGIYIKQ